VGRHRSPSSDSGDESCACLRRAAVRRNDTARRRGKQTLQTPRGHVALWITRQLHPVTGLNTQHSTLNHFDGVGPGIQEYSASSLFRHPNTCRWSRRRKVAFRKPGAGCSGCGRLHCEEMRPGGVWPRRLGARSWPVWSGRARVPTVGRQLITARAANRPRRRTSPARREGQSTTE